MFNQFNRPEFHRERRLQLLWKLRQTLDRQADSVYCADNTERGRTIAAGMKEKVAALDWAIDELDTEGAVRKETA